MKKTILVLIAIGLAGLAFYSKDHLASMWNNGNQASDRAKAAEVAIKQGEAEKENWPETPEDLIYEYWEAASKKDYDRLLVLCPGSLLSDFKKYYDQWTPSPATSVGKSEKHPKHADIQLYPAKVPFPGFPNKTIKMAIRKIEDGRLVIDGKNTIWW